MLPKIESMVERITRFVNEQDDIVLSLIVGSQARTDSPADEWSDIDVVIVTTEPRKYLKTSSWLADLNLKPMIVFIEGTAVGGEREIRVLFENGVDVDFPIIPLAVFKKALDLQSSSEVAGVLQRGVMVLKDTKNLAAKFPKPVKTTHPLPSEEDFSQAVNDFLYHFVWSARKIRRGELWTAKMCCDCFMKILLLEMIEWCMRDRKGKEYDTWHSGRFLENWADAAIVEDLRLAFAHYDVADLQSSLYSSVNLYTRLARELAHSQGFSYPAEAEEFAMNQSKLLFGR